MGGEARELLKSPTRRSVDVDNDHVYTLLVALDKDQSGFVDKHEFLNAAQACKNNKAENANINLPKIQACWASLHGVLRALSAKRSRIVHIFRSLDTNSDGVLRREEFRTGLKRL